MTLFRITALAVTALHFSVPVRQPQGAPTGEGPHGTAFFPGDTLVAVTSETSQAVLLVDVRDGRVTGTLPTKGRGPHMVAMTAKGDRRDLPLHQMVELSWWGAIVTVWCSCST